MLPEAGDVTFDGRSIRGSVPMSARA